MAAGFVESSFFSVKLFAAISAALKWGKNNGLSPVYQVHIYFFLGSERGTFKQE